MEKKYQVFVSSTYEDLKEERQHVIEALLQMNCFPVGMELFNASDDDQWIVIKGLIKECDYYVLIIGGRYGSIEPLSGKSYTQKEFEYAIEQKVPILSFIHKNPSKLIGEKIESSSDGKKKLEEFKNVVKSKLCRFWENSSELTSQVILSLNQQIKVKPRIGWIKANLVSSDDANKKIISLQQENDELKQKIEKIELSKPEWTNELQQGDDELEIIFNCRLTNSAHSACEYHTLSLKWGFIIQQVLLIMTGHTSKYAMRDILEDYAKRKFIETGIKHYSLTMEQAYFFTIVLQMQALGLIQISDYRDVRNPHIDYYELTPYGNAYRIKELSLKKEN